jgi:hypothetical protein
MRPEELLVLNHEAFGSATRHLFERLEEPSFRDVFLKNPVGVIHRAVLGDAAPPTKARLNRANRVFFALLSSKDLHEWSARVKSLIERDVLKALESGDTEAVRTLVARFSREKMYPELVRAIRDLADVELLFSLVVKDPDQPQFSTVPFEVASHSAFGQGPSTSDVAVCIETFIYAVAAIAVFVAAVAAVALAEPFPVLIADQLTREDLLRISNIFSGAILEQAQSVRNSGALTSFQAATGGAVFE